MIRLTYFSMEQEVHKTKKFDPFYKENSDTMKLKELKLVS